MKQLRDHVRLILAEIDAALSRVGEKEFGTLVDNILVAERVFVVAVGRSLLSLKAWAKRLNHLGIHTWVVGDINEPALRPGDLLIVGSGSGATVVPQAIARVAHSKGAHIIHIGACSENPLTPYVELFLRIPARSRRGLPDEVESRQIMTSLFEQCLYLLGDAVALEIAERRNIEHLEDLWEFHANLE